MAEGNANVSPSNDVASSLQLKETSELTLSRDSLSTISEGSGDTENQNGQTLDAFKDPSHDVLSLSSEDSLSDDKTGIRHRAKLERAATITVCERSTGNHSKLPKPPATNGMAKSSSSPQKRSPLTRTKSGSDASITSAASTSGGGPPIKETRASMARKQKLFNAQNAEPEPDHDYLTPLQKKEQLIKDLKKELKETAAQLEQRESELKDIVSMKDSEISFLMNEKESEIQELGDSLSQSEKKCKELEKAHKEAIDMVGECETTIKEMESDMQRREANHQEMYFKMYMKGQNAAQFERQDELVTVAAVDPSNVSVTELIQKLSSTEEELVKWQTLKRKESYEEAEKPETEADCILRFLRDSMFHYLTVREEKDQGQYLKAMVGLLGFTEVQLKKIAKAKEENKKHH